MSLQYLSKYRLQARTLSIGSLVLMLAAQSALGEGAPFCLHHPAKLADTSVDGFKGRPSTLLANHPTGGVLMSAAVRRLAGSNISTVPALVSLAKEANVSQVVGLGVGLARAVNVCKRLRPDLAQRIREEVERAAIPALTAAFVASLASDQVAVMGALEGPGQPGDAPTTGPGAVNVPEGPKAKSTKGGAAYVGFWPGLAIPRSSFGNGGIGQTVVNPVSPAR
jgi:hypothetical protein